MITRRAASLLLLSLAPLAVSAQEWKPDRPVTIVVPFPPGGTADQVARLLASEMEKTLGQRFVVTNQPGATGAIGARAVRDAPKDGYTWLGTAHRLVGTYGIMGDVKVSLDEFHQFLAITNVPVISVAANAPYTDFAPLLAALKEKPGQLSVGTAGPATSGHFAMEALAQTTNVKYRHVTYQGGAPAVLSTVTGETLINAELASDQAEMIRAKRLRPLAALSATPLEIKGYGTIPSIGRWVPDMPAVTTQFGILIPKGVPQNVIDTVTKAWTEKIATSTALKTWADERGALTTVLAGKAAQDAVWPTVVSSAWMMHAAGLTRASPETIGIPPMRR
ncbi:MAG: tripartite tricarboxylate transporter substrate binding protein [Pseudomonadota bacterium]